MFPYGPRIARGLGYWRLQGTDRSTNILRVAASLRYQQTGLGISIVGAGRFSAGGDSLLNRLPCRTSVLTDTGHNNLIESVMNIARGYQIPHCRLQRFVPHPMLNRAHIEA